MSQNNSLYRHVQIGYVILTSMLAGTIIVGIIWRSYIREIPPGLPRMFGLGVMAVVALLLVVCAIVFSSLTIVVSDGKLTWYFTGHVLGGAVPLRDIEQVEQTMTSPGSGWGLRLLPDGRLYNVSGLKAVSIKMRDGRLFKLGSDEPARLAEAIEAGRR